MLKILTATKCPCANIWTWNWTTVVEDSELYLMLLCQYLNLELKHYYSKDAGLLNAPVPILLLGGEPLLWSAFWMLRSALVPIFGLGVEPLPWSMLWKLFYVLVPIFELGVKPQLWPRFWGLELPIFLTNIVPTSEFGGTFTWLLLLLNALAPKFVPEGGLKPLWWSKFWGLKCCYHPLT